MEVTQWEKNLASVIEKTSNNIQYLSRKVDNIGTTKSPYTTQKKPNSPSRMMIPQPPPSPLVISSNSKDMQSRYSPFPHPLLTNQNQIAAVAKFHSSGEIGFTRQLPKHVEENLISRIRQSVRRPIERTLSDKCLRIQNRIDTYGEKIESISDDTLRDHKTLCEVIRNGSSQERQTRFLKQELENQKTLLRKLSKQIKEDETWKENFDESIKEIRSKIKDDQSIRITNSEMKSTLNNAHQATVLLVKDTTTAVHNSMELDLEILRQEVKSLRNENLVIKQTQTKNDTVHRSLIASLNRENIKGIVSDAITSQMSSFEEKIMSDLNLNMKQDIKRFCNNMENSIEQNFNQKLSKSTAAIEELKDIGTPSMISRIVIKALQESEDAFIRNKFLVEKQRQNIIENLKEEQFKQIKAEVSSNIHAELKDNRKQTMEFVQAEISQLKSNQQTDQEKKENSIEGDGMAIFKPWSCDRETIVKDLISKASKITILPIENRMTNIEKYYLSFKKTIDDHFEKRSEEFKDGIRDKDAMYSLIKKLENDIKCTKQSQQWKVEFEGMKQKNQDLNDLAKSSLVRLKEVGIRIEKVEEEVCDSTYNIKQSEKFQNIENKVKIVEQLISKLENHVLTVDSTLSLLGNELPNKISSLENDITKVKVESLTSKKDLSFALDRMAEQKDDVNHTSKYLVEVQEKVTGLYENTGKTAKQFIDIGNCVNEARHDVLKLKEKVNTISECNKENKNSITAELLYEEKLVQILVKAKANPMDKGFNEEIRLLRNHLSCVEKIVNQVRDKCPGKIRDSIVDVQHETLQIKNILDEYDPTMDSNLNLKKNKVNHEIKEDIMRLEHDSSLNAKQLIVLRNDLDTKGHTLNELQNTFGLECIKTKECHSEILLIQQWRKVLEQKVAEISIKKLGNQTPTFEPQQLTDLNGQISDGQAKIVKIQQNVVMLCNENKNVQKEIESVRNFSIKNINFDKSTSDLWAKINDLSKESSNTSKSCSKLNNSLNSTKEDLKILKHEVEKIVVFDANDMGEKQLAQKSYLGHQVLPHGADRMRYNHDFSDKYGSGGKEMTDDDKKTERKNKGKITSENITEDSSSTFLQNSKDTGNKNTDNSRTKLEGQINTNECSLSESNLHSTSGQFVANLTNGVKKYSSDSGSELTFSLVGDSIEGSFSTVDEQEILESLSVKKSSIIQVTLEPGFTETSDSFFKLSQSISREMQLSPQVPDHQKNTSPSSTKKVDQLKIIEKQTGDSMNNISNFTSHDSIVSSSLKNKSLSKTENIIETKSTGEKNKIFTIPQNSKIQKLECTTEKIDLQNDFTSSIARKEIEKVMVEKQIKYQFGHKAKHEKEGELMQEGISMVDNFREYLVKEGTDDINACCIEKGGEIEFHYEANDNGDCSLSLNESLDTLSTVGTDADFHVGDTEPFAIGGINESSVSSSKNSKEQTTLVYTSDFDSVVVDSII